MLQSMGCKKSDVTELNELVVARNKEMRTGGK